MMGVGTFSCRLTWACAWVAGTLACAAFAPALSATPALAAEPCPTNEQLRKESNTNPATGQPYSTELPECRAYEMVSPPYKQGHKAAGEGLDGIPVAPDGEAVGFASGGDFAEPENYAVNFFPVNAYLSRRIEGSGWSTSSTFAPRELVDHPDNLGLNADFSPDLRTLEVSCGTTSPVEGEVNFETAVACAKGKPGGPWVGSELHASVSSVKAGPVSYIGSGSADLSRVVLQPGDFPLLPGDASSEGIYELAGVATGERARPPQSGQEEVRLVNVDNGGKELRYAPGGIEAFAPFVGNGRRNTAPEGSRYHAISESGGTVFFTAIPSGEQLPAGEQQTVYARLDAEKNLCPVAPLGNRCTVVVSNPSASECTACTLAPKPALAAKPAAFQGASADGSKVFFTTKQPLLTSDTDTTNNLYQYEFQTAKEPSRLVEVSKVPTSGAQANVLGVLRNSPDGSHIYFVARGVLTTEANGNGEEAKPNQPNLYGYDSLAKEPEPKLKFVATLSETDNRGCINGAPCELWGGTNGRDHSNRSVQTTPDGRYLVFSSFAKLAGDTNSGAAYRYDFETGELTWISHAAPEFTKATEEGKPAIIAPLDANNLGANVAIDDWNRAISKNGEYVVFTTSERLQAGAAEGVTNVYLWHEGTVSMISAEGGAEPAMSSSGRDIFFETATRLVGQDTDQLSDIYDARVGGGFQRPAEPSCAPETCQGKESPLPSFGPSASSLLPAGGNLPPPLPTNPPSPPKETKKKLTPAQELAKALAACKHKPRNKRAACETQARRRYAAQQLANALKACKGKPKNKRAACESQARKRYRTK